MKVKNIMFSGFAAAILMGVAAEANAATKVVASKGYVDAVAGQLEGLNTDDKSNLVAAINTLERDKQEKFTDGAGGSTTTGFISSVTQTGGAVTAGATPFDTAITEDTKTHENTAPTTKAVADAIAASVETYTGGTDINIDEDNKVNATYESLDYSSQTDTANNADKLAAGGYSVAYIRQENGKVQVGAKSYIPNINENTATEKQAPTTEAVYNALQGKQNTLTAEQQAAVDSGITSGKVSTYDGYATSKQDTLSETQLGAVNSGITSGKVATYDGYATSKQDALDTDQLAAVNSGIDADKVEKYDSYATTKQDKLTAGDFINIDQSTGKITTTYSAGDNIIIGTDGKISTDFPEMPAACSAAGVTCVLTSENGAFVWAILAQPYSYQSGAETDVQRMIDLGYAAQGQKIPEQLYTQQ